MRSGKDEQNSECSVNACIEQKKATILNGVIGCTHLIEGSLGFLSMKLVHTFLPVILM